MTSPATVPERAPRRRLTRERVATAALALVDREGLEGLTMRALGRQLGVDPMAVYNHVPNKDGLLDAIVEAVCSELRLPDRTGTWQQQLRQLAVNYRALLTSHPNALPILATRANNSPAELATLDWGVRVLREAGLPAREALELLSAAASLLTGLALAETGCPPNDPREDDGSEVEPIPAQALEDLPDLAAALAAGTSPAVDFDEVFEAGIGTLLRGVEARIAAAGAPVPRAE